MSALVSPAKLIGHLGVFANIAGPMWALSIRPHPAILLMMVGLLAFGAGLAILQQMAPPRPGWRSPTRVAGMATAGEFVYRSRPADWPARVAGRHRLRRS